MQNKIKIINMLNKKATPNLYERLLRYGTTAPTKEKVNRVKELIKLKK
jgi:hypothetical protein